MNTETMNIRAALKERKTLDLRIDKASKDLVMAKAYCVDDPVIGLLSPTEYSDKMKSDFQSLQDMIKRREAINKGILEINAATKITVPKFVSFIEINSGKEEEEISLATAIARKTYYKDQLASVVFALFNTLGRNMKEIDDVKLKASTKIADAVNSRFAGTAQTNFSQSVYDEYVKQQQDKYKVELLNPLECTKVLQSVKDSITDYIQNIDNKLSAATETTEITITY